MTTFSIQKFTKTTEDGQTVLCAELSDLQGGGSIFQRVYPDACDEGLVIVGRKEVTFVVDNVVRDEEGDLLAYELIPTRESLRTVPEARGIKVTLFND